MAEKEKRDKLIFWMKENERGPSWVARHAGYTQSYISRVISGRDRFTPKLEKTLEDRIGIHFATETRRQDE